MRIALAMQRRGAAAAANSSNGPTRGMSWMRQNARAVLVLCPSRLTELTGAPAAMSGIPTLATTNSGRPYASGRAPLR